MYKKEEQDIYYLHKILLAIIFDNKNDYYKEISWIYDLDVLEIFKQIIIEFVNNGCFSKQIKGNIYKILVDGREIKDENYEKRINMINEIILILNTQSKDNCIQFYVEEIYFRRYNRKELKKYTIYDIQDEMPYVNESIFNDFVVLLGHKKETTDEDFENLFLPNYVDNDYYYESLNTILDECPSMFNDKVFAKRVNRVLSLNKNIDSNFNKIHRRVKRKIKKYDKLS